MSGKLARTLEFLYRVCGFQKCGFQKFVLYRIKKSREYLQILTSVCYVIHYKYPSL